jgi:hypothetical protein
MEFHIPEPELFNELCRTIGLTLLLGQKLQNAYAQYYAIHSKFERTLDEVTINTKLEYHLNKPMGVVVSDIKNHAPFPNELSKKVDAFKVERNWLAHDFDQETRDDIIQNRNLNLVIDRLKYTMQLALSIMDDVNRQGDIIMEKVGVSAEEITSRAINKIKLIANQRVDSTINTSDNS